MKTINDIMTTSPEFIGKKATLEEAANQMQKNNIGSLPVVDENEKVVGIITDRDITLAIAKNKKPVSDIKVTDAMTTDVHTINPENEAVEALKIMRTKKVGRLPVVDSEKRLKGIVTLTGIAKKFQEGGEKSGKNNDDVISTLFAIAERNENPEPVHK